MIWQYECRMDDIPCILGARSSINSTDRQISACGRTAETLVRSRTRRYVRMPGFVIMQHLALRRLADLLSRTGLVSLAASADPCGR